MPGFDPGYAGKGRESEHRVRNEPARRAPNLPILWTFLLIGKRLAALERPPYVTNPPLQPYSLAQALLYERRGCSDLLPAPVSQPD